MRHNPNTVKLNEVKEIGFYTTNLKKRKIIYEVIKNTDEQWLKDEPNEVLLIDTWTFIGKDSDDRRKYECLGGNMTSVKFAEPIKVFKITDTTYTEPYGNCGAFMHEKRKSYKELLKELIEKDIGTICDLKEINERLYSTGAESDTLNTIIKDFEKDIKRYEELLNVA
jgi:hypothetical protein